MIAPEPTQYQMVLCDIDGTPLGSTRHISPGTRQEIRELDRIGISFTFASVYMPLAILSLQRELRIKAPIVCYSGALILNEHGDPVKMVGIDRGKAILIGGFIKRERKDVCYSAYYHHDWISNNIHDKQITQE